MTVFRTRKLYFKYILFLFTLLCFPILGYNQNTPPYQISALRQQLSEARMESKKIDISLDIVAYYSRLNPDSALYYSKSATKMALQLEDKTLVVKTRSVQAGIHIIRQEFDLAQELLEKNLLEKEVVDTDLVVTHHNFGNIYNYKQEFDTALSYYLKAADGYASLKDSLGQGKIQSNIGSIHSRLRNFEKAAFYLESAIANLGKSEALKMQVLTNLSIVYFETAQLDRAINTALEAETLAKKNQSPIFLGLIYSNLCNYYVEKEEYTTAITYGKKGMEAKQRFNQNTDVLVNNVGYAYLKTKAYNKAIEAFNTALGTAQGDLRATLLNNLRQAFEAKGNTKQALQYANAHRSLKDSLNEQQQQAKVVELTEQYESEKKQQQIDLLNTQNELSSTKLNAQRGYIWALAVSSILLLALAFVWYKGNRTTQYLKTATLKHRLLQTRLNPHFLFHALNSIQGYIYQNKKEESVGYLSSFSKLMRQILESSDQDFIPLADDISAMRDYLNLQQLNVSQDYKFQIKVAETLETDLLTIPPMFTQPFIENAILHGLKHVDEGVVDVSYAMVGELLQVRISDNGKGYAKNEVSPNQLTRSMGTGIIDERIENLKKLHNYYCSIVTTSTTAGTTVELKFPKRFRKM